MSRPASRATRSIAAPMAALVALVGACTARAAAPSGHTEAQLLHGWRYREPGVAGDVNKTILTLQNSTSFARGRSFFFVDFLSSGAADRDATEVYGEWYGSLGIAGMKGRERLGGLLRNIDVTAGINAGSKSTGAAPRVYLPGVTLEFDAPGFSYFTLDLLAYIDRGRFDDGLNGCNATTWQVTPSWKRPFEIGGAHFSIEGFVDVIGAHGRCARQVIAQPQLRWDFGSLVAGGDDHLFLGIEYQVWRNKYGDARVDESVPQLLLVWAF